MKPRRTLLIAANENEGRFWAWEHNPELEREGGGVYIVTPADIDRIRGTDQAYDVPGFWDAYNQAQTTLATA